MPSHTLFVQQFAATFRSTALASGLVSEDDLALAEDSLRAEPESSRPADAATDPAADGEDRKLADFLCRLGRINTWQAQQLLEGRTRFTLGPYRIIDSIGQGGMGQVFLAEHTIMGRAVAVKVLPIDRSTPEAVAAFHREIRAQAQLDHANLVRALDAGHDGNVHYLVTEYVPGIDLRCLIRRDGPLDVRAAAGVVAQAALGLEHAHAKGLIHRDVKPGNLLVTDDGLVKVSDLGLVGFFDDSLQTDPRYGKIVGTADYLSPEQISEPSKISVISDVYSLGCTLYYAVTGKVPFPGGTTGEKCRAHCQLQPLDPRRLNSSLDAEFVDVIAHMMIKDPVHRLATAREVADRLAPWTGPDPTVPVAAARRAEPLVNPPLGAAPDVSPPANDDDEPASETKTDLDLPRPLSAAGVGANAAVSVAEVSVAPFVDVSPQVARRASLRERIFGDIPLGLQLLIMLGGAAALGTAVAVVSGMIR